MVWVLGVEEDLGLCHRELAKPYDTLTRGDFVTIALANLHHPEGQLTPRVALEPFEIDENSLCGLGPQVTHALAPWSDRRSKHRVEIENFSQLASTV
ncbi:hypothetical protein ES703_05929 [subsurface metagenome]